MGRDHTKSVSAPRRANERGRRRAHVISLPDLPCNHTLVHADSSLARTPERRPLWSLLAMSQEACRECLVHLKDDDLIAALRIRPSSSHTHRLKNPSNTSAFSRFTNAVRSRFGTTWSHVDPNTGAGRGIPQATAKVAFGSTSSAHSCALATAEKLNQNKVRSTFTKKGLF